MSSIPPVDSRARTPGALGLILGAVWATGLLASYLLLRPDTRLVVSALGSSLLHLAIPLALTAAMLPASHALLTRCVPATSADRRFWLGPLSLSLQVLFITLLGLAHCLSVEAICVGNLGAALAGFRIWPRVAQDFRRGMASLSPALKSGPGVVCVLVMAASLFMTLTPSVSQDALHYHLAVPQAWLDAGSFAEVPGNVYSRFPMNTELLFLSGLALRGEIAAKVFHWILFGFAALSLGRLTSRFATVRAGTWAALIFVSVPTAFRVATWAYVEHAGILFLVLACDVLSDRRSDGRLRRVALAGFFAGAACGTKYTYLLPAVFLFGFAVWQAFGVRVRALALGAGAGFIGGGFWYLRNLIELGNPVFPFLYSWFGGTGWDQERASLFEGSLREWGTAGWALPWHVTFDATFASVSGFDGVVGPVFFLGLPLICFAIARRCQVRPLAGLGLVLWVGWCATTLQIRFLTPALALTAVLIAVGWDTLTEPRLRRATQAVLGAAVAICLLSPVLLFARLNPIPYVVGTESADHFRDRNLPGGDYLVFRGLERWVPADGKVLLAAGGSPVFLCAPPVHADSVIENYTLRSVLRPGGTPRDVQRRLAQAGFTHLLFSFPLVFGEASDLEAAERKLLMLFLNQHTDLIFERAQTFLYALRPGRDPRPRAEDGR